MSKCNLIIRFLGLALASLLLCNLRRRANQTRVAAARREKEVARKRRQVARRAASRPNRRRAAAAVAVGVAEKEGRVENHPRKVAEKMQDRKREKR